MPELGFTTDEQQRRKFTAGLCQAQAAEAEHPRSRLCFCPAQRLGKSGLALLSVVRGTEMLRSRIWMRLRQRALVAAALLIAVLPAARGAMPVQVDMSNAHDGIVDVDLSTTPSTFRGR